MNNDLQIASLKDGFRRCGVIHSRAVTLHPAGTFSEEEVERLKAEPMLVVMEVPAGNPIQSGSGEKPDVAEGDGGRAPAASSPAADPIKVREAAVRQAITDLTGKADAFTASGKPKTEALEEILKSPVSAKERDAVWAAIQAERAD